MSLALVVGLTVGVAAGAALGVLFYGGFWITIRRLMSTRHPIAVTLSSMLIRMAAVLAGVLLVARGRWENIVACLVGLVIGRIVVSRFWVVCT